MQTARGDWKGYSHTDKCPTKQSRRLSRSKGGGPLLCRGTCKGAVQDEEGDYTSNSIQSRAWTDGSGREVQYNAKTGKYTTPKGELNAAQQATYEQYQDRHRARCRVGDVADKLTRIVDKYLPKVADENRVFIMRFPNKAFKLLKKARRIRRTNQSRDPGGYERKAGEDPSGGGAEAACEKRKVRTILKAGDHKARDDRGECGARPCAATSEAGEAESACDK